MKSRVFVSGTVILLIGMHVLAFSADKKTAKRGTKSKSKTADASKSLKIKPYPNSEILMETGDLAKLLSVPTGNVGGRSVVVIDGRDQREYEEGHIPGSYFLKSDLFQDVTRHDYLPSSKVIKKIAEDFGIDPGTQIVIYDGHAGRRAARIWFTFTAYGHRRTALLHGGLEKWEKEKRSIWKESSERPEKKGSFQPLENAVGVCLYDDLKLFNNKDEVAPADKNKQIPPTRMIDARSWVEYRGAQVRGKVGGHIPGATLIEWKNALKRKEREGFTVWRSAGELRAIFHAAGLSDSRGIVVYDQAGSRSSHLVFTLRLMGYKRVFNYVGGWRDYVKRSAKDIDKVKEAKEEKESSLLPVNKAKQS